MNLPRRLSILLLLVAAALTACGGASTPATSQVDVILTEGVKTMVASYFETQTALAPPPTNTPLPATVTPTPAFTPLGFLNNALTPSLTPTYIWYPTLAKTPTVTITGTLPTATVNSSALAFGCNNLAFITDVTYPSGTVVKPGENFTKTWKVSNTGTCDWKYIYHLVFVSGTNFDAPTPNLGKLVTVNHWQNISLNLDAPKNPGTYSASWRMSDGDGHLFGATLSVTVKVQVAPTDTSAPSSTSAPTATETATATPTPTP